MANRIFTIINLLLITAGVYLGVSTFYAILTARMDYGDPTVAAPVGRSVAAARFTPPPRSDYETIVTRNSGGSIDLGVPRTIWAGLKLRFDH